MGLFKSIKKVAARNQKSWEKNSNRFLSKLGAGNVSSQFNFKRLANDGPKAYFKGIGKDLKADTIHAVGVYKDWVTGNWGKLGKKGTADTRAAFGLKKDKKQEKEAEAIGNTAADVYQGDYTGAVESAAKSDSFVGDAAKKVAPVMNEYGQYVELGTGLAGDYQEGGEEGRKKALERVANSEIKYASDIAGAAQAAEAGDYAGAARKLEEADIKFVSKAAGYAGTGITAYEQGKAGDYEGASRTVKEGDMGKFSDLAAFAQKGAAAYSKGKAQYEAGRADYEQGKAAYDQSAKLAAGGGDAGAYLDNAAAWLGTAEKALSTAKTTVNDFKKQTKPRREADRAVARLTSGAGNPGAPPPPTPGGSVAGAAAGGGLGGIIAGLLKAFGLG